MAAAPTLGPVTAIQAMTPAFERTKKQLFQPFRFSHWWRLALTSLLAGELGSGGNWGNIPDWKGAGRAGKGDEFFFLAPPPWGDWQLFLPVLAAAVVLGLVLLAPAALFLVANILNELGVGFLYAPVEALISEPGRVRPQRRRSH